MNAAILDAQPPTRLEAEQPDPEQGGCGRYWVACQTHPQAERWATAHLLRAGYNAYLPLILATRRDHHTPTIIHRVERPLFTGYLFVALHHTDPWTPVRYTQGVRQVLMSGEKPHHVPTAILEAVQAGEALRATLPPDRTALAPGAPVTCLQGAFQGHEAVVITATHTTARIALPIFGAIREVVVSIECLAPRV